MAALHLLGGGAGVIGYAMAVATGRRTGAIITSRRTANPPIGIGAEFVAPAGIIPAAACFVGPATIENDGAALLILAARRI
jgi:hypothetical protein